MDVYGHMINIFLRRMPGSVLDIGCGAGVNLPLSKFFDFARYTGIDYAEKALDHSRNVYPGINFEVQDAFNLKFENKFDMAIISSVLILYKEKSDRLKILENAKKVLNDDGVLVAVVWKDSWLLNLSIKFSRFLAKLKNIPLPEDFMGIHFKENEAFEMFNDAGFVVDEKIHTASLYGALESVRYLNMKKYRRNFGSSEKEVGSQKNQNILKDLQNESSSVCLMKMFYYFAKFYPSSLEMFSIYVLKK